MREETIHYQSIKQFKVFKKKIPLFRQKKQCYTAMICVLMATPSWSKRKAENTYLFWVIIKEDNISTIQSLNHGLERKDLFYIPGFLFIFVGICFQSKKLCLMLIDCFIAVLLLIGNISAMLLNSIINFTHV